MKIHRNNLRGFTLVEMLLVIAIMVILFGFAVPAMNTVMRGSQLSQATDMIAGLLNSARQSALARNQTIEVRFYQLGAGGDPDLPGSAGYVRSFQIFRIDDGGNATPDDRVQYLPSTVMLDAGSSLSSLFVVANQKGYSTSPPPNDPKITLPRIGTNYTAWMLRFYPSGSTNLDPNGNWFVTLHSQTDGNNLSTLPKNYAVIQIDPLNGTLKSWRP